MSCGEEASHPIEGRTYVVVASLLGGTGVESHAHPHVSCLCGPTLLGECMLSIDSSLQSLGSGGESRLESITNHLVGIAAIGFYGMADYGFLAGEGSLHGRGVCFPAFGAPLYICEEES